MKLLDQQPSTKAPAQLFTGDAWWNVIYAGQEPSRARLNIVRFAQVLVPTGTRILSVRPCT